MNVRRYGHGRLSSAVRQSLVAVPCALFAVFALAQPPPLRVMPLGDSITYGSNSDGVGGGYRYPLYVALTNAGYNIDFVGTQTSIPHAGLGTEINHEGHSGWHVSAASSGLYENILGWLAQIDNPDMVLVHIGTNDTGDAPNYPGTIDELDALINRIAAARPYAHIIVTTLLKRGTTDLDSRNVLIDTYFNPYVEARVQAHQAAGRRVHFLDMHAYLERTDMYDNLHPNNAGYGKMAAAFFSAVTNIVTPYGDFVPPAIATFRMPSANTLAITFSKPINLAASPAVASPASWSISPAGAVTAVSALSADLRTVTLTVSGLAPYAISTLAFTGTVTDLVPAAQGGPITASLSGTVGTLAASGARAWAGIGSDSAWTTAANWTGNTVPASTETVLITGTGNNKTNIVLGSAATAGGLTFAPDAAAYTIGTTSETLTLAANATLTLAAGSSNNQNVAGTLLVGGNLNIYNFESSKTLTLNYTNTASRNIYTYGSGPITFNTLRRPAGTESNDTNYIYVHLRSPAPVTCTGPITIGQLWKDSTYPPSELILAPHTTNIICRNDWEFALSGATISGGEGTVLRLLHAQANTPAAIAVQTVNPVTISVRLECPTGLATQNKGGGGWVRGTLILDYPDNQIDGAVTIDQGNCFQVPFLAPNGTPNPLGACTNVNFNNPNNGGVYARLRVTGATASSTGKAFAVDKDRGVIENAGTGTLTLTGPFSGAGTFAFEANGGITLSGLRSGTGGLAKIGAGTLTLTASNSHTGTNFVEGGTLALLPGATLGSGPLLLSGGTLALNPAAADGYSAAVPAVTLTAASALTIPAAATASSVTLASLALNGYTLAIKAPSAGAAGNRIFVTGLANGAASGIVLNGGPATYSAANGLEPLSLPDAAIVNDTLPNAAGSAATASAAPVSVFSIAQSLTTLGQFNYTASGPATLDLGGSVLALNYLNASPSALDVINGTLTASGATANINYAGLRSVSVVPLTSDAATGLSTSKTYSHLIDFGNQAPTATINSVTFTKAAGTGTGSNYSGFPPNANHFNWNSWTNDLPPATCSGLRTLLYDMNYSGNWTGQLTGLTPGAIYEIRLYFRAWDAPPTTQERRSLYQFYSVSPSLPDTSVIYASQPNSANAIVYRYMAPTNGTLKVAVTAVAINGNVASGCFGLSNERLAAASGTPPTSGSIALSGPLSVSAALVDNGVPTALTATGSDPLTLSGTVSLTGAVRLDAPLSLAPAATVTQAFNGPVSGSVPLTLNGAGRAVLNTANPALTGPVVVSNGVLEIAHSQSLGSSAKPDVTVTAGGALAIGQAVNNTIALAKTVTLAGSGPDGLGALRFDYDAQQVNAFASVALSADAAVGGNGPSPLPYDGTRGRFDLRSGTLNLGGHTLSKVGSSSFVLASSRATGVTPGASISVQGGVFGLENATDLGGSAANTASVAAGAVFDLYNLTLPVNWTLALTNNARLSVRSGTTNQNLWAGPVSLTGGQAILDGLTSYAHHSIAGKISGSGGLLKSFGGYTYLLNPANTFSGPVTVTNSLLHAYAPGSVPTAPASLTVSGTGEFVARSAADGWSRSQLENLASAGAFPSRAAYLGIDTAASDLAYTADWPATGVAKLGPYTLTLTGTWSLPAGIRVHDGTLDLNGCNGGSLNLGPYGVQVGFDNWTASCGLLPLTGSTSITTDDNGYNRVQPIIGVGTLGSSRGVLTIDGNASVKGRLHVGRDNTSAGAVYQTGGSFLNTGGSGADGRIGESGFGYYEISGGSLTNKGYTQLSHNTTAYGTLRIKGEGHVVFNSGSIPAQGAGGDTPAAYYGGTLGTRAGYGHFLASGNGTLDTGLANLELGMYSDVNTYNSGYGFLTLEGNARVSANAVILANRNSAPLAVVTLKGGTLNTKYLQKGGNNAAGNTAQAAVNFDGGTLSVRETGSTVRTGANNTPALLTVHPGGAIIDTPAGISATLDLPLTSAKTGVGFIEVNAQGSGYIAPPAVLITGGGGTGAVAEAILTSGAVTGLRVLSPGTGYTSLPTVTLNGGGPLSAASIRTSTLGAPVARDGGLTKTGPGTLTLTATNTYNGPTTVAGGTLIPSAGSLPASSDLVLSGGTLVLGGRSHTNLSTRVTGSGALAGGSLTTVALVKDGIGSFDLSTRVTPRAADLSAAIRAAKVPGLREYRLNGSYTNTNGVEAAATGPSVQLSTRALLGYATSASGGATVNGAWWPDNSVYVYTGYLWNNAPTNVTWSFLQNMDDSFLMRLDNNVILNKGFTTILPYRAVANTSTVCTVTLSPGPHAVEIRAGQGSGGVGGTWTKTDGSRPAWGVDRLARQDERFANYCEFLTDPGDGSVFTVNNPYADLGVAFTPVSTVVPALPADVAAGVGSLAQGFSVVYSGVIPTTSDTILNDSFWSVKNLGSSNRFDRVAYVMALESAAFGRQWVWASFEPPFTDRTKLALPITSKRMCFQRQISHLTVRASANANVTNVDDSATGNIEWYPNDYNNALPTANAFDRGYVGNGTTYDFDDVNTGNESNFYGNAGGYGSFQVHNFGLNQTLFAINHFGRTGYKPCIGIGNKPGEATNRDWTFTENATDYTVRELYILTRDVAVPVTQAAPAVQVNAGTLRVVDSVGAMPVPADIKAKVGALADGYDTVYYSPVQTTAAAAYNGTAYSIDNSAAVTPFDRVAYFYELRKIGETTSTWVWVSFTAQTQDRTKLGYPNRNGAFFMWQQKVYGMDVRSNSPRVTEVTGSNTGNLEIWPSNYAEGTLLGNIGGSASTFDFDDSGANNTAIGHGCFQIHNWGAQQTLVAISHCGSAANVLGLGIGSDPNPPARTPTAYDYTWTENGALFDIRNLYVFVRPTTAQDTVGRLLADADVNLGAGAVLDLNASTQTVRSVTGLGAVSNGTLAATAILSPAGDGAVGTIALSGVRFAPGVQYRADLGDLLDVTGALDVSGLVVSINNPDALDRSQTYTLISTTGGITGTATLDTELPTGWKLLRSGNDLLLFSTRGTLLKLK